MSKVVHANLEIALKRGLFDPDGEHVRKKARNIGIELEYVRRSNNISLIGELTEEQLERFRAEITNPVTIISSYDPLIRKDEADWIVHIAKKPGVRDNEAATALEEMSDLLGKEAEGTEIYYSHIYAIIGKGLSEADIIKVAGKLSNDIIQEFKIIGNSDWDDGIGIGVHRPRVTLDHEPRLDTIPLENLTDQLLKEESDRRSLALNPRDIPIIRKYFLDPKVIAARERVGLRDPTDVELEYISQGRSDHCNHNTFRGLFRYRDLATGEARVIDNLFKTCIEAPTLHLKQERDYVISVLWDNAGVARFDENFYYVITGETHNSPSNMEAYGGAITGIVGVYRDPLGTGKGSRLIMGGYGFCMADILKKHKFQPKLHPRQGLDGIVLGVRDGGNKSGVPTTYGQLLFNDNYLGKFLVFVTAMGLMPAEIDGEPAEKKDIEPGYLTIMCGGRVGKDGVHGVTASSEVLHEGTPAGHVQIGDPYTQKKMHDFLLEARDEGLIQFITDNGGGGLSSSIGESARFSNGCDVELEKVPLKYSGLDQWEIWISESQERMTVAIRPEDLTRFMDLSKLHAVESTVIGTYRDTGKLHITYAGKPCAYMDMDFLESGFPQWKFDAEWTPPELRGLHEPVLSSTKDQNKLLEKMLSKPNIASKEFISRQYDHEVQGTKVIGPLIGRGEDGVPGDMPSDAAVIRPVLTSDRGIAFTQSLNPEYSRIDTYHMTTATIDEAVRKLIAVGADIDQIGGVDNFCWPTVEYHPVKNPDGKFKAAQLVRSCEALRDACLAYGIPLLSGKDSMYVDGHPEHIESGVKKKVSGLPTMQFSLTSIVKDVTKCVTSDAKEAGNLIYIIGDTKNELGGGELYSLLGETGLNVPKTDMEENMKYYRKLAKARDMGYTASIKAVDQKAGFMKSLIFMAGGGNMGFDIDLRNVGAEGCWLDEQVMYSESTGRFLVEVMPEMKDRFEEMMGRRARYIGKFNETSEVNVISINEVEKDGMKRPIRIIDHDIMKLKKVWKAPFKDMGYVVNN